MLLSVLIQWVLKENRDNKGLVKHVVLCRMGTIDIRLFKI